MNNILNKSIKDRFVAISHLTILALAKLNCLPSYHLYFYLSGKQTFVNGLVGVFDEVTIYDVQKYLSETTGKSFDTTTAKYYLNKLAKHNLIVIHNLKPLIISLPQSEIAESLKNLKDVLDYVRNNEKEFAFDKHFRRATEFYATFNIEPVAQPKPTATNKAKVLDELINSRPTRNATENKKSNWEKFTEDEDSPFFDPFAMRNTQQQ